MHDVPLLDARFTAAVVLGAHDWSDAGLGRSSSFLRSAKAVVGYLIDSAGLGLDPSLVIDLFDDPSSAGEQLARVRDTLDFLLRERREEGRAIVDVLFYYVGHGQTDDLGHLSLLVRRSRRGMETETSIRAPDLARVLKIAAPQQRRIIILDCCFSEAAAKAFIGMSGSLDQSVAATAAKDFKDEEPRRGTLLLCSSPVGEVSIAPLNSTHTLFTGAVMGILREGIPRHGAEISLADLRDAAYERMVLTFGANAPRPVLHQVNAAHGDLTRAPIFHNPMFILNAKRNAHQKSVELNAQREAAEKAAELKAQRAAAQEEAELKATRETAQRDAELEAQRNAAQKEAELEAQRNAAQKEAELEAQRNAAQKEAELEAQRNAAQKEAELEAQRNAAQKEAELEAQRNAAQKEAEPKAQREAEKAAQRSAWLSGISPFILLFAFIGLLSWNNKNEDEGAALLVPQPRQHATPTVPSKRATELPSPAVANEPPKNKLPSGVNLLGPFALSSNPSTNYIRTGNFLLAKNSETSGVVINILKNEVIYTTRTDEWFAISRDGKQIAVDKCKQFNAPGTFNIVSSASGIKSGDFVGHKNCVRDVAFSFDGKFVVSASADWTLRKWDLATRQTIQTFKGHKHAASKIRISYDGRFLLSGGDDLTCRVWNAEHGTEIRTFNMQNCSSPNMAISPDGEKVALNDEPEIAKENERDLAVYSTTSGKLLFRMKNTAGAYEVYFSNDNQYVLSRTEYRDRDGGNLRVFKASDGTLLNEMQFSDFIKWAGFVDNSREIRFESNENLYSWNFIDSTSKNR